MDYPFALDEWMKKCPLYPKQERIGFTWVVDPHSICGNLHLRAAINDQYTWGKGVPIDLFILKDGEPPHPMATKIGGLPYRPADKPWPTIDGKPAEFIGQFNFTKSREVVGDTPADMLLIFGLVREVKYLLEWSSASISSPLTKSALPKSVKLYDPVYGHRLRTNVYPFAICKKNAPTYRGKEINSSYLAKTFLGTQIGPFPFIQQDHDFSDAEVLCTVTSVTGFPVWESPIGGEQLRDKRREKAKARNYFNWADVGTLFVFKNGKGRFGIADSSF